MSKYVNRIMYERLRKLNLTYEQAMEKFGANEKPWMELNSAEQDLIKVSILRGIKEKYEKC